MRREVSGGLILVGLALATLSVGAQEAPRAPEASHRFELVGERREPAVLDRLTGRLFFLESSSSKARAVVCVDATAGTLITRPLTVTKEPAPAAAGEVPWPARDGAQGPARFVVQSQGRELMLFDGSTGRLYVLQPPEKLLVIDPLEATVVERPLRVTDKTGMLKAARTDGNEAAAIGALKTLNSAQTLFREGDKEQDGVLDYGSLTELKDTKLVDEALGSGTKQGYIFESSASASTPEFLWMATARPQTPGETGTRYFVTNQSGVIYYGTEHPFSMTDDCQIPKDALPVGR